jgi:hypothetical protein
LGVAAVREKVDPAAHNFYGKIKKGGCFGRPFFIRVLYFPAAKSIKENRAGASMSAGHRP